MSKEEAFALARELGYGDVTEKELMEVLCSDKELSDGTLSEVAGGMSDAEAMSELLKGIC